MAVYAGPDIVENGLVLSIDFGNRKSSTLTGTTVRDLTTNNLNGTLVNMNDTWYSTLDGGSLRFFATNNYVTFSNSSLLNITTGDFAIEMFLYYERAGNNNARAASRGGVYLGPGWHIYAGYTGTLDLISFTFGRTAQTWTGVGYFIPNQNTWYHVVTTRLNGTIFSYVNGNLTGSLVSSYDFDNPTNDTRIGTNANTGEAFKGRISIFKQYNIGLNADQVKQNYNAIRGRYNI